MIDRTSPSAALRLALCALFLTAGGCSFLFVDGPPKNHAQLPYFDCSTSKAWPLLDVVLAASLGLGAGAAFVDDGSPSRDTTEAAVAVAEAAAFAISAVSGYQKVAECREARDALIARLATSPQYAATPGFRAPAPDPWVTPPPGLFAPRMPAPPPEAATEPTVTTTETPDTAPARPLPSIPAPAVDPETPR